MTRRLGVPVKHGFYSIFKELNKSFTGTPQKKLRQVTRLRFPPEGRVRNSGSYDMHGRRCKVNVLSQSCFWLNTSLVIDSSYHPLRDFFDNRRHAINIARTASVNRTTIYTTHYNTQHHVLKKGSPCFETVVVVQPVPTSVDRSASRHRVGGGRVGDCLDRSRAL